MKRKITWATTECYDDEKKKEKHKHMHNCYLEEKSEKNNFRLSVDCGTVAKKNVPRLVEGKKREKNLYK